MAELGGQASSKTVGLMTGFSSRMTAESQTERGVEFPARKISARMLPRRRVLKRPAKVSVAIAGADGTADLGTVS
jgi:hypothetical protein